MSDPPALSAATQTTTIRQPEPWAWATYAACVWSLGYTALGLFWAFGGGGFPYGETDQTGIGLSPFVGLPAETTGTMIAGLSLAGGLLALAMARPWGRMVPRPALLGFGWTVTAVLLLLVPDIRALIFLGYLPAILFKVGFGSVDLPVILNQGFCLVGGLAWGAATLTYQRGTTTTATTAGSAGGPRWGRRVTYLAAALPLPYAASRLAWALGIPLGISETFLHELASGGATLAEVSLGGMAVIGAVLTLGLTQRWGEVLPGWLPFLGGKRVPPLLAIIPATLVSVVLIVSGISIYRAWLSDGLPLNGDGWGAVVPGLVFLPWGIALGLATYAYGERRQWGRP